MTKSLPWLPMIIGLLAVASPLLAAGPGESSSQALYPYREPVEIRDLTARLSVLEDPPSQIAALRDWIAKHPANVEAHRAYQDHMNRLGESTSVLAEYQALQEKNSDDPMFNFLTARLLAGRDSETFYRKSLALDPNYYWGHLGLAYYFTREADPTDIAGAREHLERAAAIDPSKPNAFVGLLTVYLALNDGPKYLQTLETLTKFFPDDDRYFVRYVEGKYSDLTERRTVLEAKAKELPNSGRIQEALGSLFKAKGQKGPAIERFNEALRLEQQDKQLRAWMHIQIAELHSQDREVEQALIHLKAAVGIVPQTVLVIKRDPAFAFLQGNAEFEALMKSLPTDPPVKKGAIDTPRPRGL